MLSIFCRIVGVLLMALAMWTLFSQQFLIGGLVAAIVGAVLATIVPRWLNNRPETPVVQSIR